MINTLHIKNIGIIDDLTINLNDGFNVLTGETGSGKTLIIDSLEILAGGRFSKDMIRNNEDYSFVELSLFLQNNSLLDEDNIIISREIHINGKNLCKINGRLVTVNELKEFMSHIIDIHAQNDNLSILNTSTHIDLINNYASKELNSIFKEYSENYNEYINIKFELNKNYGDEKERTRKLDLLKYQENEITSAKLKEGEEEELNSRRKLILNSEKIVKNINEADNILSNDVIDGINLAIHNIEKIADLNNSFNNTLEKLKSSYYDLDEISRDISILAENNYFDENEQYEIEERLDLIYSLKRKYGNNIPEIIEYGEKIKQEILEIENLDDYINNLQNKLKSIESIMQKQAEQMHKIRLKASTELSNRINNELFDLEMKNANFEISVIFDTTNKFTKNGLDNVEFFISTNIGERLKPLTKIVSGGEMSRIMLAIKTVVSEFDEIPVIVFDEIDIGISGIVASKVGDKMKSISKSHQVICITHLAPIAAKGNHNYFISKISENNKTKTTVKKLSENEIIEEIARISSGTISNTALEHAKELRSA
ncbi:MAG: DNA repair protein RecN [Clostridia bacterium]|nr:DNA repair protein RecN [Clostridia bacterium]